MSVDKPTAQELNQLQHLKGTTVVDYLKRNLETQRQNNDRLQGELLGWGQGRAQALSELLDLITKK